SQKGVLRGLHFQKPPHAQSKLVRVLQGEVLDVVVDIRKESPTFGQHFKTRLSAENNQMLYIPARMAHGFLALEENSIFLYKCDNYYHPESEAGIAYNDPELNIDWGLPEADITLSDKDKKLPFLKAITS
ncbi:MAG: dTDP-4-dehydrorhamnose 3,5-epimerase, partial [Bacteroidota bacterium]